MKKNFVIAIVLFIVVLNVTAFVLYAKYAGKTHSSAQISDTSPSSCGCCARGQ